jgi:DNA replication initiation complex subunit (GINS family)
MITYQEIYDILRKEKYNETLQELPTNFLQELAEYLREKKQIVEKDNGSLFSDTLKITRKQLDNTISLIKEIFSIRNKKVLNLAFTAAMTGVSKRDTENLLEYEKKLFESSVSQLEENQKKLLQSLEGQGEKSQELKNLFIRFKSEVQAFMLPDGSEIGPFRPGDVANLPKEISQILISDNKALEIDADS